VADKWTGWRNESDRPDRCGRWRENVETPSQRQFTRGWDRRKHVEAGKVRIEIGSTHAVPTVPVGMPGVDGVGHGRCRGTRAGDLASSIIDNGSLRRGSVDADD